MWSFEIKCGRPAERGNDYAPKTKVQHVGNIPLMAIASSKQACPTLTFTPPDSLAFHLWEVFSCKPHSSEAERVLLNCYQNILKLVKNIFYKILCMQCVVILARGQCCDNVNDPKAYSCDG